MTMIYIRMKYKSYTLNFDGVQPISQLVYEDLNWIRLIMIFQYMS